MRKAIEIWQPRYSTGDVLVATYKVSMGKNYLRFTKSKSMPDLYSFSGKEAAMCPIQRNGKIDCFVIPLSFLTNESEAEQKNA